MQRVAIERARAVRAQPAPPPVGEDSEDDEAPLEKQTDEHDSYVLVASNTEYKVVAAARGDSPCAPAMPVTHEPDTPQPHREKVGL